MHNTMAPWLLRSFLQKSFPTIIVAAVFMLTSMSFVVPAQSQVEIVPSWDYNPVLHHTRIADDKIETNTVAAGDLDGDGDVDFVTQRTWRGLTILMNDGLGNFTVQQEIDGIGPWAVGVADIDGDGDLDILPSNGNVHVLFNDGNANFTPSTYGCQLPTIFILEALGVCWNSEILTEQPYEHPVSQGVGHDHPPR